MLPGNIDPRRPEKQQRYKPPPASNNAAPGEDLTPDYMNILDSQRKSMQTPRSDRFKVVKIESTEPFKRGRWKCMDFLDQSYAKVFQQNYNNRSSEGRPPSPKNNDPTKIHSCASWSNTASYVDLQSSMLQIFYRQNSLETQNQCLCSANGQNVTPIGLPCCDESRKYQNHVLMPGMVSSSFVGLDFPIEFNFIPDNPGHLPLIFKEHILHSNSNNNQCIINHLECCCKNQTSNVDIQKFHQNMSSEQVTIQPTQISNYAQISPDLIQKNLNVPPQELLNQSSGINYVQNLIPNDPNKTVRNLQNQQTSVLKEEQIIDNNQNGVHKVQQILSQQNYIPSSQANGTSELNKSQYNNNNPIYVNIQNLTCPQKSTNINESNSTTKNLISDQQITSTSTEAPNSVALVGAGRGQDLQNNKNTLENVCDSTTENMAQNNQPSSMINGNYVSHNLVQNSNETMPTEYFQNLVQNLDPNNPNLVQKFVVPNGNMVQNCVSPNGNNVHYIVYSANSNSIQQANNNGNICVPKPQNGNPTNQNQNFVPSSGSYVQNIVQNTVNTSQNLITNNENVNLIQTSNGTNNQIVTSKGNSNQNLPQINNQSNSNPNLMQNAEKITQNVNLYQGQISVVEASSCTYKQQSVPQPQQQEVTPIYQNSQNSIQNSLPSNTCIHAFLTEERALVQNTNTNESPGGKLVSNLPVDTKIEALMDLVKKHLKCTVMEDVNVLKHKILELKERIAQLEYENELLKNQYKRNSMQ